MLTICYSDIAFLTYYNVLIDNTKARRDSIWFRRFKIQFIIYKYIRIKKELFRREEKDSKELFIIS